MTTEQRRIRRGPAADIAKQVYCALFSPNMEVLQNGVPDERIHNFKIITFNMLQKKKGKHTMYDAARAGARHIRSWLLSTTHSEFPKTDFTMHFSIRRMKYTERNLILDDEDISRENLKAGTYINSLHGDMVNVVSSINEEKQLRNPSWVAIGKTTDNIFSENLYSVTWRYDSENIFRPLKVLEESHKINDLHSETPTNTDVGLLMHAFDKNEVHTDL